VTSGRRGSGPGLDRAIDGTGEERGRRISLATAIGEGVFWLFAILFAVLLHDSWGWTFAAPWLVIASLRSVLRLGFGLPV